jgi:hypothetical protein
VIFGRSLFDICGMAIAATEVIAEAIAPETEE